ncbi:2',3'-cyclic nucleotide 2'-phosphodiesterase/3'-nucleotidase bifunctional periplasmic precursor protein [Oceaniovalibus guishaninsula JLT2003]|uniref:2',3'-cyclic nucleotide 2'-phosphodiesterase/3'-nucleotidase bifunctional periplasmic protein n=1 Tax=Oceaniovalibus guishaninsula JLT2003 TaxID=1231392 RepID=K2HN21_9RHOB|nr:5'-nucleotidase C-terminal domain-containing protein [Oceaniovalibus guishaninsula]EKE44239.1 2',3'-cyclic nucleotide 2'-phosphodiesterase/3'-nucleotidase bifunctional periplasmic precursor protein [Oceaniovalibus guishaninsula JLT2003]
MRRNISDCGDPADGSARTIATADPVEAMATRPDFGQGTIVNLRIVATSDLHGHVLSHDFYADRPVETHGLSLAATCIARLRAEAPNSVLLDNGDFLFGTLLSDPAGLGGHVHPMIAAMNATGYDAATLGNHEFDHGLSTLGATLADAAFPVVCANARPVGANRPFGLRDWVPPWTILQRQIVHDGGGTGLLRIGVIGFLPPQTADWNRAALAGSVAVGDIVDAARRAVPALRGAGADIVVALCHSGIGAAVPRPGMENAATALAGIGGIDAIVAGHTHLTFPGPDHAGLPGVDAAAGTLCGVPAAMPGRWGASVASIDLRLTHDAGRFVVTGHAARSHPILACPCMGDGPTAFRGAPAVLRAAADAFMRARDRGDRIVGTTQGALHSYFAAVGASPAAAIVGTAMRRQVADALRDWGIEAGPVVAAASSLRVGGRGGANDYTDIPAGRLTMRRIADLHPHPNRIHAYRVTGALLRDWLETAASAFSVMETDGRDGPLIDPEYPLFNLDTVSGLHHAIDLSRRSGRIADLRWRGRAVGPDDSFVLAINSHRAAGGGGYPVLPEDARIDLPDLPVRTALESFVASHGAAWRFRRSWRFAPVPGCTAVFDTGPGASAYMDDVGNLPLTHLGPCGDGFHRFRLDLGALPYPDDSA